MDKSQGRIQAGAVPVRRGRGGILYFRGGHFTTGGRLFRDSPARAIFFWTHFRWREVLLRMRSVNRHGNV